MRLASGQKVTCLAASKMKKCLCRTSISFMVEAPNLFETYKVENGSKSVLAKVLEWHKSAHAKKLELGAPNSGILFKIKFDNNMQAKNMPEICPIQTFEHCPLTFVPGCVHSFFSRQSLSHLKNKRAPACSYDLSNPNAKNDGVQIQYPKKRGS